MRRQGTSPARGRRSVPNNSSGVGSSRNSRHAPNSVSSVPQNNLPTNGRNDRSSSAVPRTGSRLNSTRTPIIMTKAQLRRKNAMLMSSTSLIRTVVPAEGGLAPGVTTINTATSAAASSTNAAISRAVSKRRMLSEAETSNLAMASSHDAAGETTEPSETVIPVPLRFIRSRDRGRSESDKISPSVYSIQRYRRVRNRVSFALPDFDTKGSVLKALSSDKILPRILAFMNWNELLPLRLVCKAWFGVIESNPKINEKFGTITIRHSSIETKMAAFNASSVTWHKFRFIGPVIFDMTKPVQNEFWNKHGPFMTHLEINNRAMSLTGLVEILARCPRLEFFKCNWTPEMYAFNSDLIRKYYGIHFNNGTFAQLRHLVIECSSFLTDSALGSVLKWCGGSIRSLALTSPPDEDILTRLKPRWSVESIKNYFERFGYTENLQYLDFSWSNLSVYDVRSLCSMEMNLRGITLNYCKLDDDLLRKLLLKHGETLQVFKIEGVPFTESIFSKEILPKVKVLHIGGVKGVVQSLGFLQYMPCLEELSCHNTQWLEQSMILRPFNSKTKQTFMKSLDLGGGIRHSGNKNLDPNLNKTWFSDFTGLMANIKELNLSQWSMFGTNMNFRSICSKLVLLEKLIVRDWKDLNDVGTTGLYEEEIHQDWGTRLPLRPRVFVGQLERLKVLDLSGTSITDASVFLALYPLKNLRSIAIDGTRITDNGLRGLINKIQSLDRISAIKCSRVSTTQSRFKRTDGRSVFLGKF